MARKREGEGLKRRIEERNGIKYVYESTSSMVNGKKESSTNYLGRLDPETGELIPKRKGKTKAEREEENKEREMRIPEEIHSKEYGTAYFLDGIQRRIRIGEDISASFGRFGDLVMGMAMAQACCPGAFCEMEGTFERTFIGALTGATGDMSSPRVSELTRIIGEAPANTEMFFAKRLARTEGILAWDTTTHGTYSMTTGLAEWVSNNKDGESIPQMKLALATDGRGVPVFSCVLPGSLSDAATVGMLREKAEGYAEDGRGRNLLYVMDNGFENAAGVRELVLDGISFVMPLDTAPKAVRALISGFRSSPHMKDRVFDGHAYRVLDTELGMVPDGKREMADGSQAYTYVLPEDPLCGGAEKVRAFVCYDSKKQSDEEQNLKLLLHDIEQTLEGKRSKDAERSLRKTAGRASKYFSASLEDGKVHLERKGNAVSFGENREGMFVMLSSSDVSWEAMMAAYDARRLTEQAFDSLKNEMDCRRIRTGNRHSAWGRFFVNTVALMMRCEIAAVIRENGLKGKTVDGILRSMGCINAVGVGGEWRLTPITKNCRELFGEFGMRMPPHKVITKT